MSANLMPSLAGQIAFMREAARAPRKEWPAYAVALKKLPLVGVDAGMTAAALAASGRVVVRQLPHLGANSEGPARALIAALVDVLQAEFDARFEPPDYVKADL